MPFKSPIAFNPTFKTICEQIINLYKSEVDTVPERKAYGFSLLSLYTWNLAGYVIRISIDMSCVFIDICNRSSFTSGNCRGSSWNML